MRDGWEQTRTICICSMQPYSKKRLVPDEVMPLPWDKGQEQGKQPALTREERQARYEAAKKRYGIE